MSPESSDHLDRDACVDLLAGLMSARERDEMLRHARRCPRCERLLAECAAARERARAASEGWLAQGRRAESARETVLARRRAARSSGVRAFLGARRAGPLAAALAVAALAAVVVLPALSRRDAIRRIHWLPAGTAEVTTRDPYAARPDPRMREGLEAYARHDVAAARRALSAAKERGAIELVRRIYLGNTLAQQGEHEAAIGILADLPYDLVPEPWRSESRWTLSVALRARGETARADSLIEALSREPGPVGERTRRVLGRK